MNLIFSNNGASQTPDLNRCGNGWYKGGVWYTSQTAAGGREEIVIIDKTEVSVYPNTFSEKTTISFSLPVSSHVTLKVYNLFGAEVTTLADKQFEGGKHEVEFKAGQLPAGTYIYRLSDGSTMLSGKMMLTK